MKNNTFKKMHGKLSFDNSIVTTDEFLGRYFETKILDLKTKIFTPEYLGNLKSSRVLKCPMQLDERLLRENDNDFNSWGMITNYHEEKNEILKINIDAIGFLIEDKVNEDKEFRLSLYNELDKINNTMNSIGIIKNKFFQPDFEMLVINNRKNCLSYWKNKISKDFFKFDHKFNVYMINIEPLRFEIFKDYFKKVCKGYILNPIYEIFYNAIIHIHNKNYRMSAIDMGTCIEMIIDELIFKYLKRFHDEETSKNILNGLYHYDKKRKFIKDCKYFEHEFPNFQFIIDRNKSVHKFIEPTENILHKEIYGIYDLLKKYKEPIIIKK